MYAPPQQQHYQPPPSQYQQHPPAAAAPAPATAWFNPADLGFADPAPNFGYAPQQQQYAPPQQQYMPPTQQYPPQMGYQGQGYPQQPMYDAHYQPQQHYHQTAPQVNPYGAPVIEEQGGVLAIGSVPTQPEAQTDFVVEREEEEEYSDEFIGPWEVSITIVEAKEMKFDNVPDLYVKVQTYAETLRTRVVKKNKSPVWNQDIKFQIMDPLGKPWTQGIMFEIVIYHPDSKHKTVGVAKLCLGDMKHNQPNDIWFYIKHQITKEVVDGQLHVIVRVKGLRKLLPGEEVKKTDQAVISHTVTKVTKKVTRKTMVNADGVPVKQDVQVTTTVKKAGGGGGAAPPAGPEEEGFSSVALSPAQATAMFSQNKSQQKPQKKKKGFTGNSMFTTTFAEAFGEEDEPEGDWKYS